MPKKETLFLQRKALIAGSSPAGPILYSNFLCKLEHSETYFAYQMSVTICAASSPAGPILFYEKIYKPFYTVLSLMKDKLARLTWAIIILLFIGLQVYHAITGNLEEMIISIIIITLLLAAIGIYLIIRKNKQEQK